MKVASGASGNAGDAEAFTAALMKVAAGGGLSFHYYAVPRICTPGGAATGFSEAQWATTLGLALKMDDSITKSQRDDG